MANKYYNYELEENKIIKIPMVELERLMSLDTVKTIEDACWIWCEDNGKIVNEEQEELDKKAKANRITATIHQARADKPKERKKVERKPDLTKENLITTLAESLQDIADNVQITNVSKLIEFDFQGEHYKLDLIRQRKPKAKG